MELRRPSKRRRRTPVVCSERLSSRLRSLQSRAALAPGTPSLAQQQLFAPSTYEQSDALDRRNAEIHSIAQSIADLADMFKDLSSLVIDQGTLLDRVDWNVEQMNTEVKGAVQELTQATRYVPGLRPLAPVSASTNCRPRRLTTLSPSLAAGTNAGPANASSSFFSSCSSSLASSSLPSARRNTSSRISRRRPLRLRVTTSLQTRSSRKRSRRSSTVACEDCADGPYLSLSVALDHDGRSGRKRGRRAFRSVHPLCAHPAQFCSFPLFATLADRY